MTRQRQSGRSGPGAAPISRRGFLRRLGGSIAAAAAPAASIPATADADPLLAFVARMAEGSWAKRASLLDVQAVLPARTRAHFDARMVRERLGLDVGGLSYTWPDDAAVGRTDEPPHYGIGRKSQFVSSYTQPAIDRGTGNVYVLGGGHHAGEDGSIVEIDAARGTCRLVTPGASLRRTADGPPPGSKEIGPGNHPGELWGDVNARGQLAPRAIHGYSFCKAHKGRLYVWGLNAGYIGNHGLGAVLAIDIATGRGAVHLENDAYGGFWWDYGRVPFGLTYDTDNDRVVGFGLHGGRPYLMACDGAFEGRQVEVPLAPVGSVNPTQWFSSANVMVADPTEPRRKLYFWHENDDHPSFECRTVSYIPPRGNLIPSVSGPLTYRRRPKDVFIARTSAQKSGWTQDGTRIYRWDGGPHIYQLDVATLSWSRFTPDRPGGRPPDVPVVDGGEYFALEFLPRHGIFVAAGFSTGDPRRCGAWIYKPVGWRGSTSPLAPDRPAP